MTLPLLIAGLILELAGKSWFSGAGTVGLILILVGGIGLLIQLLLFAGIATTVFRRR